MEAGRLDVGKSAESYGAYRFANAKSIAGSGGVSGGETFAVNKANAFDPGNANRQTIAGQASFSNEAGADAG